MYFYLSRALCQCSRSSIVIKHFTFMPINVRILKYIYHSFQLLLLSLQVLFIQIRDFTFSQPLKKALFKLRRKENLLTFLLPPKLFLYYTPSYYIFQTLSIFQFCLCIIVKKLSILINSLCNTVKMLSTQIILYVLRQIISLYILTVSASHSISSLYR